MDSLLEPLQAALRGRYAIERELGRGGMAIVYLARDCRHDRRVAVKVFRPELATAMGAERFLREIQVTAKLSHPNILPLYDSGEAGGLLFYVMPFVEGETLAALVAREQELPLEQAVQIAREVAEALSVAHSYGIVHRDIKPQNIMLSGGHAIVADFGIARAVSEAGTARLTETGMAIGTPAYMSPEQASASEHVDARSDIYSLGCVLYEMLVGQPPFTGPTAQAVLARQTMDDVPPLHTVRRSVPRALEDVVLCALEKSPADRYHTAANFADALRAVASGETPARTGSLIQLARRQPARWWRRVAMGAVAVAVLGATGTAIYLSRSHRAPWMRVSGPDPHDVAVLYFQDLGRGSDLGYVADGLTEGLIGALSRVPGLHVISRNGVAPYRGGAVAPDSVARALNVGTLVAGSVEPDGDRLRIQLRLIEGGTGVDFERASLEVSAAQLLSARDSVVDEVARMLRERLGEELRVRQEQAAAPNAAAWALLLRAERLRKLGEDAIVRGDARAGFAAFRSADSVLAVAEAAFGHWAAPIVLRGQIAYRRSRLSSSRDTILASIGTAVGAADRALAIDPNDAQALELRGTAQYWHWLLDVTPNPKASAALLQEAQRDLESAVRVDPELASAHSTLSHLYNQTSGIVSALLEARLAYTTDAFLGTAPEVLWRLYAGSYDLEQFTQARSWCEEGARRFPGDYRFAECRLWGLTMPGVTPSVPEMWRLVGQVATLAPEARREYQRHRALTIAGAVLARAGLADSARAVLLRARAGADVDPRLELPFVEAYARTIVGDTGEAIALLGKMVTGAQGGAGSTDWAAYWWWRGLQSRPDFHALVRASR